MRFRAIWASLLTVLLLSLTPAASACQMKCILPSAGMVCHKSPSALFQQDKPADSMAGMHLAMHQAAACAGPLHRLFIGSERCVHHVCTQQAALLNDHKNLTVDRPAGSLLSILVASPSVHAARNGWASVRGSPHLPKSSPVSLNTALRV